MADVNLTQQDWEIRLHVYDVIVATGQAPSYPDIAQHFAIPDKDARQALHRLNDGHALFLRPESDDILMAHPLSAIDADYEVMVDGITLYANCAWDSLGIPAMLHKDARITMKHPLTRETISYAVKDSQLLTDEGGYVHFALPFIRWYDDLIDT